MYKNRRLLVVLGFLLGFCSGIGGAQSTAVSVTAVDQTSQVWINGTISYTFQPIAGFSGKYQWQGADLPTQYLNPTLVPLDASGFASFTLPSSTAITPVGTSWSFKICPNATSPCITSLIPTMGSSQDISSALTAVMTPLNVGSQIIPRAYQDSEITTSVGSGQIYFNTNNMVYRVNIGTPFAVNWQNLSTGGGGGTPCNLDFGVNFANFGHTAFQCDPTFTFSPSLKQLSTPATSLTCATPLCNSVDSFFWSFCVYFKCY